MVDFLIAFESFDELFSNISVYPNEEIVVKVVFFVVKLEVKVSMRQTIDDGVLCLQHNGHIGRRMGFSRELSQSKHKRSRVGFLAMSRTSLLIWKGFTEISVFEILGEVGEIFGVLLFEVHGQLIVGILLKIQRLEACCSLLLDELGLGGSGLE